MSRCDRQLIAFAVIAAMVSAAYWALWIATAASATLVLTLGLHIVAAVLTAVLIPRRSRPLALALALTVPIVGPLAAALSTIVAGRVVYEKGHITTVDEAALRAEIRELMAAGREQTEAAARAATRLEPYYRAMLDRAAREDVGMNRCLC